MPDQTSPLTTVTQAPRDRPLQPGPGPDDDLVDVSEPEDASPFGVAQRALIEGRRAVNMQLERLRADRARLNDEIRQLVAEDRRLAQALTPFDREARKRSAT
jgi:hypothetical protein